MPHNNLIVIRVPFEPAESIFSKCSVSPARLTTSNRISNKSVSVKPALSEASLIK